MQKIDFEIFNKKLTGKSNIIDNITVKHTVLDDINAKLQRIDHTLLNMMINQGKTIREAELEETVERQRNELAGAYRIIEGLKKDIRPHYSTSLLTADRTELMATIYKKNDLFPDTDILSLEKSGKAFMEWLIPSTSRPFRSGITKAILEYDDLALVENSHQKIYQCGGSNSYTSIKVGVASHKEMTTTIRTNLQDI